MGAFCIYPGFVSLIKYLDKKKLTRESVCSTASSRSQSMIAGSQSMTRWCHITSHPWSEREKWWHAWTLACVQLDFSTLTIQDPCLGGGDTHRGWWVAPPHLVTSVNLTKTVPHRPAQWRQSQRQNWDALLVWFYMHIGNYSQPLWYPNSNTV